MATRQYIGARYVPLFFEGSDGSAEWAANTQYEALTIVTRNGNSYTSRKQVPANIGAPEDNPTYWVSTGMYNQQVELYRQEVEGYKTDVEAELAEYQANTDGAILNINNLKANNAPNKRRYIFIGDSYAAGYTPETGDVPTDGWPSRIKERFGLSNDDCYILYVGGVGFGPNTVNGGFNGIVTQSFINGINDPDTITDIVICGGRNDVNPDEVSIRSAINDCYTRLHNAFPNARLYIAFCGWDGNASVQASMFNARQYWELGALYASVPVIWMQGVETAILNKRYLSPADLKHPNAMGNRLIAEAIITNLFGGGFKFFSRLGYSGELTAAEPFHFVGGADANGGYVVGNTAVYASWKKDLRISDGGVVTVSGNHGELRLFNLPEFPIASTTSSVGGNQTVQVLLRHTATSDGRIYTFLTASLGILNGVVTIYIDNLNSTGTNFENLQIHDVTLYPFTYTATIEI